MVDLTCHSEYESGSVYTDADNSVAAFAFATVEDPEKAIEMTRSPNHPVQEGVVVFRDEGGRNLTDRAELWAKIHNRISLDNPLQYHVDIADDCRRARVPATVAGTGKASIAAYLAAHDFTNSEIATALDVGSRTVSQYLSDFKTGER